MSLIRCPECKKMISDKAFACPKCGYPISEAISTTMEQIESSSCNSHKKQTRKCIKIISTLAYILLVVIIILTPIYFASKSLIETQKEKDKYPLFVTSSECASDPLGLGTTRSILGKNINEILNGYIEGTDYTITKNEHFCSYEFANTISYYEKDAVLTIYTPSDSDVINMIEYSYRVGNNDGGYYSFSLIERIKDPLTAYYDVDPTYTIVKGTRSNSVTKQEFNSSLINDDIKALYHIDWTSDNGSAGLLIANLHEERSIDWIVSFTN